MKSIQDMRSELHRLKDLYEINVCGEGGEFETIVLDCPLFVKHRLKVDKFDVITVDDNDLAPVAHVFISNLSLEAKDPSSNIIELYENEEQLVSH